MKNSKYSLFITMLLFISIVGAKLDCAFGGNEAEKHAGSSANIQDSEKIKRKINLKTNNTGYFHRNIREVCDGVNAAIEAVKCDPFDSKSVWDQEYLAGKKELCVVIKDFMAGKYAASASKLKINSKNINSVVEDLKKVGFALAEKDDQAKHEHNRRRKAKSFLYTHDDGGAVRIFVFTDKKSRKKNISLMRIVRLNASDKTNSRRNDAFVISNAGVPLPTKPRFGMRLLDASKDQKSDVNFGWTTLIFQDSIIKLEE